MWGRVISCIHLPEDIQVGDSITEFPRVSLLIFEYLLIDLFSSQTIDLFDVSSSSSLSLRPLVGMSRLVGSGFLLTGRNGPRGEGAREILANPGM